MNEYLNLNNYKSYFSQLISLQNKAVEIISKTSWNKNLCYREQKILSLKQPYTFETSKYTFLFINNFIPLSFNIYFVLVKSVHNRATRNSLKPNQLYIPRYKASRLQRSIKHRGAKIWNDVDSNLKSYSFQAFKKLLKRNLIYCRANENIYSMFSNLYCFDCLNKFCSKELLSLLLLPCA